MRRKNVIGLKFNFLTIVEIFEDSADTSKVKFKCLCDCGNFRIVSNNNIKYNKTKSCGCKNSYTKNSRKQPGTSTFLNLYKCYVKSAKYRKHEFSLNKEEFKELTKQNCYYCGKEPKNKHRIKCKNKEWEKTNTYIYNGIDRLNSNIGYTKSNCVTCCNFCNKAKSTYSINEFLENIKRIYEHTQRIK